jgi:diguanylate cyclase (GGDEF)-like protein/PAS domain S-box-containing protein
MDTLDSLLGRSIFDNTRDGVMITDPALRIVDVNAAFLANTGFKREELVGQTPAILKSGRHDADFYREMWRSLEDTGKWQGEIWDRRGNGDSFLQLLTINALKDADGSLQAYVGVFTDIHQMHLALTKLQQVMHFDALTELPNRTLFMQRLEQAIASSTRGNDLLAVILLDLDGFKALNEFHGREVGDALLTLIAQRLTQLTRPGDGVARLGGDEFALFLAGLSDMDALENAIHRILSLCDSEFEIAGHSLRPGASLGVTVFPFDSADAETLLRHAGHAMYLAKMTGGNCFQLFDAQQDQQLHLRRLLLDRLGEALERGELELHYQPKVNLRGGRVVGVEALLRWNHPEMGLLLPETFLPRVAQSALIADIGDWVIQHALRQLDRWHAEGIDLPVSVNIAARHLQRPDFIDSLRRALAAHPDLPGGMLELEILESAALENTEQARELIEACQALGVRFALDDFGTGYASLAYLREIPADVLKIDQSFVHDILESSDALTLVEAAIGLATAFRRVVVAEGVENAEQGVLLMRLGCDIAQGNGIAPAMPTDAVAAWVRAYKPEPQWALWADTRWEMSDFPLLVAQYDHLKWVRRVMFHVEGANLQLSQHELCDAHSCRFGHWYYGHGKIRYGNLPEFQAIEPIHDEVHRLGPEIVAQRQHGNLAEARRLARELLDLKDAILARLGQLQQVVADKSQH